MQDRESATVAVVGAGRLGIAMAEALRASGTPVEGPLRRGELPSPEVGIVLLCVPDRSIGDVADSIPRGPLVGHCSGATSLDPQGEHEAFSLHPLMTVPTHGTVDLRGVPCAVAGHAVATTLALRLGMRPIDIADEDRAAYHAAASMASNFLITLEEAAAQLASTAGLARTDLVPLIRATVENWAQLGPAALTGPIARGDEATIERHRTAIADRTPDLLALYDALAKATRR